MVPENIMEAVKGKRQLTVLFCCMLTNHDNYQQDIHEGAISGIHISVPSNSCQTGFKIH